MTTYLQIKNDLNKLKNEAKIIVFKRFFKTAPGQYGEGDQFIGLTMPQQRVIARQYFSQTTFADLEKLIVSPIHEYRMTSLLILTYQYAKANSEQKRAIFNFYINHNQWINNWDLIDITCPKIMGEFLLIHPEEIKLLDKWVKSDNLWQRRLAVLVTFPFIKNGQFELPLKTINQLLRDKHDLIHKATGWMLREIGKKDQAILLAFLDQNAPQMPRTMLRYAIEKLDEKKRRFYLCLR